MQRHLRKLSRSLAMRGKTLVKNRHGQLVLPRTCSCVDAEGKRVGPVCSAHVIRRIKFSRDDTDPGTGEVTTRTVRRYRLGYYQGGSGFVLLNDGVQAARDVQRILDSRSRWALTA